MTLRDIAGQLLDAIREADADCAELHMDDVTRRRVQTDAIADALTDLDPTDHAVILAAREAHLRRRRA